jgi:cyclin B
MKMENTQLKKINSQFRQHLRILSLQSKQKQRIMPKQMEQDQQNYYIKDSKYCFVSSKNVFFNSIQNMPKNSSIRNNFSKKVHSYSTINSISKSEIMSKEVPNLNNFEENEKNKICLQRQRNYLMPKKIYKHKKISTDNSSSTACSNNDKERQIECDDCEEKMELKTIFNNLDKFNTKLNNEQNKISVNELNSNVKNVKEYIGDILENLIEEEENSRLNINPNYLKLQKEINADMRAILIDWLIEVNKRFNFQEETLYKVVNIIDSYLSKKIIKRKYLQLLGITSLIISAKLNEIYLPKISNYSDITDKTYNQEEIKKMEEEILKTLNFNLLVPTQLSFYEIISQKLGISDDINKYKFGEFLMQSFMLDNNSLYYSNSTIACAACYIVMKFCKMKNYKNIFDDSFFGHKKSNNETLVKECAKKISETITLVIGSNLKSIINKYSSNKFYNEIIDKCQS